MGRHLDLQIQSYWILESWSLHSDSVSRLRSQALLVCWSLLLFTVFYNFWLGCQKVVLKFLIGKLHKAVPILFRCPKIRKSKSACVKFSQSDVYVLNSRQLWHDDVHGTLRLLLPSMAAKHYALTGILRFSNFLPKSQNESQLLSLIHISEPTRP